MGCGWAAHDDATTIFEISMGLVDRGAALTLFSQYPHEQEVPPLTGLEAIGSSVEGNLLVMHSRLSLNLSAQTLEQVLSRRRKMLIDMSTGIEFELREALGDGSLFRTALKILRRALAYGALAQTPDWFNNKDNFSRVLNEVLYLQRILSRARQARAQPLVLEGAWPLSDHAPRRLPLLVTIAHGLSDRPEGCGAHALRWRAACEAAARVSKAGSALVNFMNVQKDIKNATAARALAHGHRRRAKHTQHPEAGAAV